MTQNIKQEKNRQNRFDSFELSDSDISQTSLKNIIIELQRFFPEKSLEITQVNDLIDDSLLMLEQTDDGDSGISIIPVYNVKFIKKIRTDMQCSETLKNIRSMLMESRSSNEIVNWDLILKEKFNVERYLTFVYALMRLFDVDHNDRINKDLSFNAGRTYICLLGIPGAKR